MKKTIKKERQYRLLRVNDYEAIQYWIDTCEREKHVQQVAYSSLHKALTQTCFTCCRVRTNMSKD